MYADDAKNFAAITDETAIQNFQNDINKLQG